MLPTLLSAWLTWHGCYVGVEQTAHWQTPFQQPGISASVTALVGVKRASARVVYIQPLQIGGFGPALQFGISMRVF